MSVAQDSDVIPRLKALLDGTADDLLAQALLTGYPGLRAFVITEIGKLYDDAGESIDDRHLKLVTDFML